MTGVNEKISLYLKEDVYSVAADMVYRMMTERKYRGLVRAPKKEEISKDVEYFLDKNLEIV